MAASLAKLSQRAVQTRNRLRVMMVTQALFMDEDVLDDAWRRNQELLRYIADQRQKRRAAVA